MKNSYVERAQKFIRGFFPFMENWTDKYDVEQAVYDYMIKHPRRNVQFANGISRVAIITADYVIKFDYDPNNVEEVGGCENEVSFYSMAKDEGKAYLFAEITPYEYCGQRFYIMPRVEGIGRTWHSAEYYMTWEEQLWCDRHGLSDLHCNNYGWVDGRICIIDYACCYED